MWMSLLMWMWILKHLPPPESLRMSSSCTGWTLSSSNMNHSSVSILKFSHYSIITETNLGKIVLTHWIFCSELINFDDETGLCLAKSWLLWDIAKSLFIETLDQCRLAFLLFTEFVSLFVSFQYINTSTQNATVMYGLCHCAIACTCPRKHLLANVIHWHVHFIFIRKFLSEP